MYSLSLEFNFWPVFCISGVIRKPQRAVLKWITGLHPQSIWPRVSRWGTRGGAFLTSFPNPGWWRVGGGGCSPAYSRHGPPGGAVGAPWDRCWSGGGGVIRHLALGTLPRAQTSFYPILLWPSFCGGISDLKSHKNLNDTDWWWTKQ